MLGTNIQLNIYSIQTLKELKKQTKNWNQAKAAAVNIQDLFVLINLLFAWSPHFSVLDFQAYYYFSFNVEGKTFEWRIKDGEQWFLI